MKSKSIDLVKLMLASALLLLTSATTSFLLTEVRGVAARQGETFSGEIIDSSCVRAGSHAGLIDEGISARNCTLACVQHGAKLVLYDAAKKRVYKLDDQKKPAEFAGDKVKVAGTLDKSTNTIHVTRILGTT